MTKTNIRILPLLAIILVLALTFAPYAYCADGAPKVIDEAGLLTAEEITALEEELLSIEADYGLDAVILTVNSTGGMDIQEFADLYYENNGYGIGDGYDGMILAIDMGERHWQISTMGKGVTVLTEAALDIMEPQLVDIMGEGDFYNAFFMGYAENIRFFADYYQQNGTPYDYGTAEDYGNYDETYDDGSFSATDTGTSLLQAAGTTLPPALIVGFVVSFIMARKEKSKLTSVHFEREADEYIRPNSLIITADRARYMYSNVVVTPRNDNNNNAHQGNAGSHVHVSSGGRSHGGRGGSF